MDEFGNKLDDPRTELPESMNSKLRTFGRRTTLSNFVSVGPARSKTTAQDACQDIETSLPPKLSNLTLSPFLTNRTRPKTIRHVRSLFDFHASKANGDSNEKENSLKIAKQARVGLGTPSAGQSATSSLSKASRQRRRSSVALAPPLSMQLDCIDEDSIDSIKHAAVSPPPVVRGAGLSSVGTAGTLKRQTSTPVLRRKESMTSLGPRNYPPSRIPLAKKSSLSSLRQSTTPSATRDIKPQHKEESMMRDPLSIMSTARRIRPKQSRQSLSQREA